MRRALRLAVVVVLWITHGLPALAAAQSERGTISGVVTDSTKAGLPGVSVNVTNTATNQTTSAVSSTNGSYSAANLPPGAYRVEATLSGFRTTAVAGIQLSAGASARVDVTMQIGGVEEVVDVVAASTLLQTEDARVSTNVSNQLIDQLPLVVGGAMRSVFDLVGTVAEAKGTGQNASLGGGQAGGYSASLDGILITTNRGANTAENAFLAPSLEAITEFSVETNGFKPEFGQAAGGAITFASKSGTNQFHGSIYEFLRDESLDSRDFFATGPKPVYNQHNYGASWGGPVRLPGYNGRDKTFFFTTYEGFLNEVNTASTLLSVPTPEMWNGDFSNLVDRNGNRLLIYDPATTRPDPNGPGFIRDPFPNNQIPQSRFSQLARNYLALARSVVVPNQAGTPGTFAYINNNYLAAAGTQKETTHKFSIKLDHTLTTRQRVSYLYNLATNLNRPGDSGPVGLPVPFNGATRDGYDTSAHRLSWDWTRSRMVNRFSFGINTLVNSGYSGNVGGDWADQGICIPNAIDCNKNFGNISFSEFQGWGSPAENGTKQPRWTIKNDLTFTASNHTVKTGVTYDLQVAEGFGQQQIAGQAGFSYLQTAVPGITSQTSGSSMASFLLGYANTGSTEQIREVRQIYPYFAMYAQDDWRVGNKLALNYGVRYEFTLPAHEGGDKYTDFHPTRPNPRVSNYPGASIFAGFGEGRENRRSLIEGYYGAIAPRVSLSFRANDKTIMRAGAGRSFGRVTVPGGSSHYSGHIGNWTFTAPDIATPAFLLDQGLPYYDLPPYLNPSVDNNLVTDWWGGGNTASRPGYYDSWTVSLQRDLYRGLTAEVDYNGSYGKNLPTGLITPNQVPMSKVEELIARVGAANVKAFLDTIIRDAAHAQSLGISLPYPEFVNRAIQTTRTVAQALRPFPQYNTIRLSNGGGDKSGKSHYHAAVLKLNQRMTGGLTVQSSYTWSRIMTDSDRFGAGASLDSARPGLEWSIGALDQTHNIKINTVYELPFGSGRRWLRSGLADAVAGGWRLALTQSYVSGVPLAVTANSALTIFNTANRPNVTGEPWRAETVGDEFDPRVDLFYNKAAFAMPVGALGNAPRTNPDERRDWSLTENISLAKTFKAAGVKMDVRVEAFNLFNHIEWGAPNSNFSDTAFGQVTSQVNAPRQMQLGLKMYW
jgi:hypothetical protein